MATVELTKDNFEQIINDNNIVFVDFWAPWCAPCRTFGPIYESASDTHTDAVFGKVNTEDQPELAALFQVTSIPTLMVFREQIGIFSQPGALPGSVFEDLIKQVKALDMDDVRKKVAEAEQRSAEENAGAPEH